MTSSRVKRPTPIEKAPSICPTSMAALIDCPTSITMSLRRIANSPVLTSISTSEHAAPEEEGDGER
jgi:hypothetical protein